MSEQSEEACLFCHIVSGKAAASFVDINNLVVTVMDVRQFHPGHVLVIPRRHVPDIRAVDIPTAEAVMRAVVRVARAVDAEFPSDGLSVWNSAGRGANQEIPHLHFHVHPRMVGDDLLRIYPIAPPYPDRGVLDAWARQLKSALTRVGA
jgi:histidine triad (HIT) family protein